ncbi:MAG: NrfD/PsrC family molybdoenzyme membrane anchor subunit [Longimicrobiales bacterium]|nr:NrfD/PsrC family molybdoenzyme membrane anchor subunit [Longimicrobiales bacterium]
MSHDLGDLKEYPFRRLDGMPRGVVLSALALIALGAIGFFMGLADDADRAWRAYTYNWIFFAGIAQGAVLLAAVVALTRGVWSRPVRRIAVSFVAFLPIAYLILFPPLLLWAPDHVFPWLHHDVGDKAIYLNMPFLTVRNVVGLLALLGLSIYFAYWQLRPDAGLARDAGWDGFGRLTRNWQGQEQEEEKAQRRLSTLAPIMALVYAVAFSFIAFDFVMSLDPHWLSTLIGPYVFMAAFLGGIAATAVVTVLYRRRLDLAEYVEGNNLHDLGKLFFAFSVFWTYLFWSQYIVIWYGNLPNEQSFLVNRLQDPYRILSILVLFTMFILPFFGLLGVKPKKTPGIMATIAGLSLLGLWVERYILIYPTLYPQVEAVVFGTVEVAIGAVMLGLLMLSLAWFGSRFPMLQVWQPATEVELLGVEVEEGA